jgi:hypothetical protein
MLYMCKLIPLIFCQQFNLANAINATVGIDSGGLVVATQVLSTVEVTGIEYFLVQHLTIVTPLLYGQQRVGLKQYVLQRW